MSVEYDDKDIASVLGKMDDMGGFRWGESADRIMGLDFSESEFSIIG